MKSSVMSFKKERRRETKMYVKAQISLKSEILRSWNLKYVNIVFYCIDRYNHVFYFLFLQCCHRKKVRINLLRPQISFFIMTTFVNIFMFWILSLTCTSITLESNLFRAFLWGIALTFLGSLSSVIVVWSFHYFYTKNIYAAFERASTHQLKHEA